MRKVPARVLVLSLAGLTAAPLAALGAQDELQKCDKPIGKIAINEPQDEIMARLRGYNLQSPTQLIRMMVQQSNCFQVVERGVGMQNIQQERALAGAGEAQAGSNMGKGQMAMADYVLVPDVMFSENNAGGMGAAVGGVVGRRLGVGGLGGGLKFKEAQTTITISDVRTTVQVASAQGAAKKRDFAIGMLGWAGGIVGAVGGYTNTNEGKVIAASFLDNYNKIVADIRANPDLQTGSAARGDAVKAGAVYNEGDVLGPKIDNLKLHASAAETARVVTTLKKTDDVVFLGEEKDGFLKVEGSAGPGWVKKAMVAKR